VEAYRPAVLGIGLVIPDALEMWPPLDDLRRREPVEEIGRVELRELLHRGIDAAGLGAREREPAALQVDHVLEPRLRPSADRDVRGEGGVAGDERREPAAIADSQKHDARWIDSRMPPEQSERAAVAFQLGREIGPRAIAFAVAHARLVHAEDDG